MSRRVAAIVAVSLAVASLAFVLHDGLRVSSGRGPLSDPIDFLAFRCAARVAAQGADPYLAEPLRTCERDALAESHLRIVPHLVVPAPLPPYALLAFAPLGTVPFRTGCAWWLAILIAAYASTCVVLARASRTSLLVVVPSLLGADLLASALIGQIVPIVVLAACAAAAFLQRRKEVAAAIAAAATLLEPHLGLPLCIALWWYAPRSRWPLLGCVMLLAVLTLWYGGLARSIEYVANVLPAQERSEGLAFGAQYGLSASLAVLGVPKAVALTAGAVSYAIMAAVGMVLGRRAARRTGEPAFAVLAPITTVLIGGPYVHIHQMAAALPLAAYVLAARPAPPARIATAFAICCLAVPWQSVIEIGPVMAAVFPHTASAAHVAPGHVLDAFAARDRLAEDAWGGWAAAHIYDSRTPYEALLVKLPTWTGLVVLVSLVVGLPRTALAPLTANGLTVPYRHSSGPGRSAGRYRRA